MVVCGGDDGLRRLTVSAFPSVSVCVLQFFIPDPTFPPAYISLLRRFSPIRTLKENDQTSLIAIDSRDSPSVRSIEIPATLAG
ncbi:hypothetical protein L1987_85005 [Smallanthus sonchifolius]|uniref:Uncharacterized protein n=1 Tax=Smallanthus sonchifolius TaxID=185202 RepID=A0ACB8XWI4_9ASTR|nr:hypothetical protein L1987_85005 [Smallanthus sonchifolius]